MRLVNRRHWPTAAAFASGALLASLGFLSRATFSPPKPECVNEASARTDLPGLGTASLGPGAGVGPMAPLRAGTAHVRIFGSGSAGRLGATPGPDPFEGARLGSEIRERPPDMAVVELPLGAAAPGNEAESSGAAAPPQSLSAPRAEPPVPGPVLNPPIWQKVPNHPLVP
jgi:hypothetical protein